MLHLLLLLLPPPASAQTPGPDVKFELLYTGRLLGYFRNPDRMVLTDKGKPVGLPGCPDIEKEGSPAAKEFYRKVQGMGNPLLLGMGDNNAPELFARMFEVGGALQSKDNFYWSRKQGRWVATDENAAAEDTEDELSGRSEVLSDNVGCFLRQLQYTALVPGKHDFYVGPERLRQYARFLVKTDANKDARLPLRKAKDPKAEAAPALICEKCSQVHMLAANLAIAAARPDGYPPVPDYLKRNLKFDVDGGPVGVDVPAVTFPWLRKFRVGGAYRFQRRADDGSLLVAEEFGPKATVTSVDAANMTMNVNEGPGIDTLVYAERRVFGAKLCQAGEGGPDDLDPEGRNCIELDRTAFEKMAGGPPGNSMGLTIPEKQDGLFNTLEAGRNYGVCLDMGNVKAPRKRYYCARFFVHHPFFQYPMKPQAIWNQQSPQSDIYGDAPRPYVIDKERNLAIFGVVNPDMKDTIGSANYTWVQPPSKRPSKPLRVEATVVFADPASALEQLWQRCELDAECKPRRKVLLAQMPATEAKLLGLRLRDRFDLIIAQTDSKQASGEESHGVTLRSAGATPAFLAVPREMYEQARAGEIDVTLQKVAIERKETAPGVFGWTETHGIVQGNVKLETAKNNWQEYFDRYIRARKWDEWDDVGSNAPGAWSLTARVQRVVLDAMRRKFSADVALLQRRDLFQPAFELRFGGNVKELQPWLDRVIWKGDFAIHYAVTGAALKAAMAKSKEFAANERDPLNYDLEKGRDLLAMGIVEDRVRKQWLIRGEPVEDGRMYSVVSSDYLAFGDTGYPDLRKPVAGTAPRVSDLGTLVPLSALVCRSLEAVNCGEDTPNAQEYLDWTSMKPASSAIGMTPRRRLLYWVFTSLREGQNGPLAQPSTPASERAAQNAATWSVALEKADLGYIFYGHNQGSEDALAQRFAGIPISQVQAPNSSTLSIAYRIRAAYGAKRLDWFALSESAYSRVFTRQANGGGVLKDQKANMLALEGGVTPRLWPAFKQVPDLKALLSVRYQTQFAEPFTAFKFSDGTIRQNLERAATLSVRMGLRYQSRRSWVESGFQSGAVLNLPVSYNLNLADGAKFCPVGVGKGKTLGECLAVLPLGMSDRAQVVKPNYRGALRQQGFFLNYRVMVPLPFGNDRYYVQENRGDLYLNSPDDTAIDTKLFDAWSHSLLLPLWGNFSLVPKVDFWFYRNKLLGSWFASRQTSIALQYRFEWRQGLPWRKVLQYPWPPPK